MPNRALESTEDSVHCLEKLAAEHAVDDGDAKDSFAREYAFADWSELHGFMQGSAILLDKHTAQLSRVLATDMQTAWEFLADPKKLQTWMFPAEFEAKPCAPFKFAPEGWHGTIGIFEEGRELRFDAVAGGWTWFSLASIDGETVFTLRDYLPPDFVVPEHLQSESSSLADVQPGGEGTHWQGVLAGWHSGVDTLQDLFTEEKRQWDYEAIDRLYKILITDYHKPY